MWKFFVRTIVSVFSILILAGIGYFFYEAYMLKYPTCVSHASVITRVTDALNSTQLATEFGFKITRLQNVEESLYDRGKKTRLCVATAVLDNGKTTPVAFKIIGKNDSYHLEAEFTKVVDVVLDEVIKRWEELLTAAEESVNEEENVATEQQNADESGAVVNEENNNADETVENTEESGVVESVVEEAPVEENNNVENAPEENNGTENAQEESQPENNGAENTPEETQPEENNIEENQEN